MNVCTVLIFVFMPIKIFCQSDPRTVLDDFYNVYNALVYGLFTSTQHKKIPPPVDDSQPFPCQASQPYRSSVRPTSVHRLRPGDIDVMASMGDSLTAGYAARGTAAQHIAIANRGLSPATGGQGTWREVFTVANLLKVFNPNLVGYSYGDAPSTHWKSQFNVAEGAAMSKDMPYMATVLVRRIRADKRVNFEKDWKLVTLMIGANDFCSNICRYRNPMATAEINRRNLMKTLDYLQNNLPRTMVNLAPPPNIEIMLRFKNEPSSCTFLHLIECPCIFGKANDKRRHQMVKVMRRWQEVVEEVSKEPKYRTSDNFTVVLQPFIADLVIPERAMSNGGIETDWSLLSVDCFHLSAKGNAKAGLALWINLQQPVGMKSTNWPNETQRIPCPTEKSPYFYTWKNSGDSINNKQISTYT